MITLCVRHRSGEQWGNHHDSFREIGRWAKVNHERARGIAIRINGDSRTRAEREEKDWGWSAAHTIDGPCSGCCPTNALRNCPRCGGRLHREPAIIDEQLGEALFCQQERTDGTGRATRTRSAPSEAETAAKMAAMRRRDRERTDRWIGRV